MAKFYKIFVFAFLCYIPNVRAAVKTWVGLDGDNWNNPASWSPAAAPTVADDVVITGFVGTINVNTSLTIIRSLNINGGADVVFSGNANNRNILINCATCSSGIEAGSTATFTGETTFNFACDLYITSCLSFVVDGSLIFTGGVSSDFWVVGGAIFINGNVEFSGSGNSHLACTGGVTHLNGYVTYTGGGETSCSPATLKINSNATYEIAKNGGVVPNASWNSASNLVLSGMVNNDPDFASVSVLGNMSWDCPNQTVPADINRDLTFSQVYIYDTGASEIWLTSANGSAQMRTWTILDDYTQSGGVVNLSSGNNGTGRINFKGGNFFGAMTLTETSAAGRGIVEFSGTQPQTAYFINLENTIDIIINCSDKVLLNTKLTINPGAKLGLTSGFLITSAANLLTLSAGATVEGGSLSSYVKGPFRKVGNTAFTFPIGQGNSFAPLGITAPAALTDTLTAEYFDDPYTNTLSVTPPLVRVSHVEHWQLVRKSGTGALMVTLNWTNGSFSGINELASLTVARFNGTSWVNKGGTATGAVAAGSIQSDTSSLLNWFTFGSKSGIANPLPIELKSFAATAQRDQVILNWVTATEKNNARFVIERSLDGAAFAPIGDLPGAGTTTLEQHYAFPDLYPVKGPNYYRLRQVDFDGGFSYSPVRVVQFGRAGRLLLYPSPALDVLHLHLEESLQQESGLQIFDAEGREVLHTTLAAEIQDTDLRIDRLPVGTYYLRLLLNGREQVTESFIRKSE